MGRAGSYKHITTSGTTQAVCLNSGVILGSVSVNQAAGVASLLSIFDAAAAGDCTAGNTVAIINAQNANVPGFTFDVVLSRGLMYTLSAGTPDITITFT